METRFGEGCTARAVKPSIAKTQGWGTEENMENVMKNWENISNVSYTPIFGSVNSNTPVLPRVPSS